MKKSIQWRKHAEEPINTQNCKTEGAQADARRHRVCALSVFGKMCVKKKELEKQ